MSKGTILLVEDDAVLATHIRETLAASGYGVLEPDSPEYGSGERVPPDLVIMDTGPSRETHDGGSAEILRANPDVPVIFLEERAGGSEDGQSEGPGLPLRLVKPVTDRELAMAVELALCRNGMCRERKTCEKRMREIINAAPGPEGLELADIIDIPALQRLMDVFFELTQVGSAFVDIHGNVLVGSGWGDICTNFHRVHPETVAFCRESDTVLTRGATPGTWRTYRCHNNMRDIATPIMADGKQIGNLFMGQFFFDDDPMDYDVFREQARRYGFNEEEYIAAYERVPRWSRGRVDTVMRFYMQLAEMISSLGHSNIKLARALMERGGLLNTLKRSEEKYRVLLENAQEIVTVTQGEYLVFANPMATEILGYSNRELTSRPFADFIHPDDRKLVAEGYRKRVNGIPVSERYPFRAVCGNGDVRWLDLSVVLIEWEGEPATLGFLTDITRRKYTEDALRESEERFRRLIESSEDLIASVDRNGVFRVAGGSRHQKFGISLAEVKNHRVEDVLSAEEAAKYRGLYEMVFESGKSITYENVFSYSGISETEVTTLYPVRNNAGEVVEVGIISRDITAQKQAEVALRESEEKYRLIVENQTDLVVKTDLEGRFLYASPSYCALFGKSEEELLGTVYLPLVHEEDIPVVEAAVATLFQPPHTCYYEERALTVQGWKWLGWAARAQFDSRGEIAAFVGSARDITERKQAEESLRNREAMLRKIFDLLPIGLWIADRDGRILNGNAAGIRIWGAEPRVDPSGYGVFKARRLPSGEEIAPEEWALARTIREGVTVVDELLEIDTFDGKKREILNYSAPVLDENGQSLGAIVVNQDVTERRRAEEALSTALQHLNAHMDNSPLAVIEFDPMFRVTRWSKEAERVFGWTAEEMEGKAISEMRWVYDGDGELVRDENDRLLTGKRPRSLNLNRNYRKDGTVIYCEWYNSAIYDAQGNLVSILSLVLDVTERRRAEEALRESEEKYRFLFDANPVGTGILEMDGHILDMNRSMRKLTGYTLEEFRNVDIRETYVHPEDRDRMLEILREKGRVRDLEVELKNRGGSVYHVLLNVDRVEMGGRTVLLTTVRDITERRRTEQALRESEGKFTQLVEQSPISIEVYDPEGLLINANHAYEELWHVRKEPLIGTYNILRHPHIGTLNIQDQVRAVFRGEKVTLPLLEHDPNSTGDFPGTRKRAIQPYIYPIVPEPGVVSHVVLINVDVTEQKQLEQKLLHAQKMETIGRLAGGVAHDFNNILTVINANAELALMFMPPEDQNYETLEEIRKSGERAANLTRQLLAFSRRQIIEPRVINLNRTLLDMDKMLRRLIGEHIELVTIPDESLWPVKVDPGQIEQVLTNLVVNARDAMPGGGKLTIETRNVVLDEVYAKNHPETVPGNHVMFAVSDTGVGMDAGTRAHLFEPFFTTKPKGSGTGLGLSTCYGIVKQNNGGIWVYSEPGRGTTVKVYLPAIEGTEAQPESRINPDGYPRGSETVLVVEDDTGIRAMITRHLASSGYRVLSAANGDEALTLAEKFPQPIHLLVTDVIMPLMGGRALADRLEAMYPGLRILFMSGYTDNSIVHHGVLEPGIKFIQKPFSLVDFMRKIREVLEG